MKKRTHQKQLLGSIILLVAALIWGSTFVAQSIGMNYLPPFTYNGARMLIGSAVLLPVIALRDYKKRRDLSAPPQENRKELLLGGLLLGGILALATGLQQVALLETAPGKAGFLTALYVVEVPVAGIFLKKKIAPVLWGCVFLALFGMYLLCIGGVGFSFSRGDLLVFLCSFVFAAHILVTDHFSRKTDVLKLCSVQFYVAGAIGLLIGSFVEKITLSQFVTAWNTGAAFTVLYAGVLSCGVAYTFQAIGQKLVRPTLAGVIMSFESVFSLLSGMLVLSQFPTLQEGIGALLMFLAIVLAQLPFAQPKPEPNRGEKTQMQT